MPDKGFGGVCPSVSNGYNCGGKSLKTSLIALHSLSKDQVSISDSESFVERCKVCCGIVLTLFPQVVVC